MKWMSFVLAFGLLFGLVGCDKGKKTEVQGEGDKKLAVIAPGDKTITQGKTEKVTVTITRTKFDDPVDVEFDKTTLPKGVTVDTATKKIDKGVTSAEFTLTAAADADIKDGQVVKITAKSGSMSTQTEFKVNVKKS